MTNLFLIGFVGMVCFSLSGIPQMIRSIRDGHSDGMAVGTIWLWLIGELCYILYTFANYSTDFILLVNYCLNFSVVGGIAYYKHFPRHLEYQYNRCVNCGSITTEEVCVICGMFAE